MKGLTTFFSILFIAMQLHATPAEEQDVVIIGGGVGAMTSAIYLARAGYEPVVIEGENPGGTITMSHHVENWPGAEKISGEELIKNIRAQAEKWGVKFISKKVTSVDFKQYPYKIVASSLFDDDSELFYAKSCIIAMGTTPKYLNVPGEKEFWGRGVSNCAVCDGALYKDKTVAVVGGGDAAVLEADYLSQMAKKVYILIRKDQFRAHERQRLDALLKKDNIEVKFQTEVKQIEGGEDKVSQLALKESENVLPIDGLFLAIGSTPNSQLFVDQLELVSGGYIKVSEGQHTSVEGIFAIGDIADPVYKQAISAAGDGAKAALEVEKFLKVKLAEASHPIEVCNAEQFNQILQSSKGPVVVKFYSSRCRPCIALTPYFDQACEKLHSKMTFIQVNISKQYSLLDKYNVLAVPTVAVFSNGKLQKRYTGFNDVKDYLGSIQR